MRKIIKKKLGLDYAQLELLVKVCVVPFDLSPNGELIFYFVVADRI